MSPYVLYVRFLITKGLPDIEHIQAALKDIDLNPIDPKEYDAQHDIVFNTIPFSISRQIESKKYEGDFQKWMKILEVDGLWSLEKQFLTNESRKFRLAADINNDPILRSTLRGLILKGQKPQDICQLVNTKFSYMLTEDHVNFYKRYFWDPQRMARKDWKEYLKTCDNHEKSLLFLCLTESADVVKTFLDIPTQADVLGVYQQTFVSISQKVKHYLKFNDPDSNNQARLWIKTMLDVGDKYKKYETGNIEDFGKTLQMQFEYIENDFPTPDEATKQFIEAAKLSLEENKNSGENQ